MTPFEGLPAARQKEIVAAADRDLADNVTLNRIYLAGRDIYDAVFTERNWYNIVQDMEDGEPVFNVGLDAYVAGSDIDAAFHGKPAEWPYIWQARSCYGPGCSSFSELLANHEDASQVLPHFTWDSSDVDAMESHFEWKTGPHRIGDGVVADLDKAWNELVGCSHSLAWCKMNDIGDAFHIDEFRFVAVDDWDKVWQQRYPWEERLFFLYSNGWSDEELSTMSLSDAVVIEPSLDYVYSTLTSEWEVSEDEIKEELEEQASSRTDICEELDR